MPSFYEYTTSFDTLWKWISAAPSQVRHPMRTPTVITTTQNIPNARTMILRDVTPTSLIFFTDKRSPKLQDIQSNPHTTIHCYDAKRKLQLRIRAHTSLIEDHPHRNRWRSMGLNRFQDYGSMLSPGTPLEGTTSSPASLEVARENFCVLGANVTAVELLKLSRDGHQRVEWIVNDDRWTLTRLVP